MLSLDNGKSRLKFFFALFAIIFVLFVSSPVVAFANEGNNTTTRVHIVDKDNYYTDEEKQRIVKEIGKSEQVYDVIKFIAPVDNEDAKKLSFQEMLDTEYPDLFFDGVDVAVYAPWLKGEYAGAYCEKRSGRFSEHRCFYIKNVDSAKERDGSVDNMISLVKVMQEEQLEMQGKLLSTVLATFIAIVILSLGMWFLPL